MEGARRGARRRLSAVAPAGRRCLARDLRLPDQHGGVDAVIMRISRVLADPWAELRDAVRKADAVRADETSWRLRGATHPVSLMWELLGAATSGPTRSTACGRRISSRSAAASIGCTSPPRRICSAAGSSAGRWTVTCAKSSSSTRYRWPSPRAGRRRGRSISDHGGQYTSLIFTKRCRSVHIDVSMAARATALTPRWKAFTRA